MRHIASIAADLEAFSRPADLRPVTADLRRVLRWVDAIVIGSPPMRADNPATGPQNHSR